MTNHYLKIKVKFGPKNSDLLLINNLKFLKF